MKRLTIAIAVLCCAFYAIAAGPNQTPPLRIGSPKIEIAELETLIAKAKASGQTPDPAWTARIRELIPSIKGHASNSPADLQVFQSEGGFAPGAVIRPTELTPLEAQIKDLEFQLSGGMSFQGVDEVTFANLKEQLNELYAQRPANRERNPLDQGNSVCPGTYIGGIPFYDTGTTVGMGNEYNPIDPWCNPSASNDVVYEFTPQVTQIYNISLQGSSYDCYLYVNTTGGCPGSTQVTCNDDYFGLQSFISTTLIGGQTYYIIIDGYSSGREGDYVLSITDNCDVVCQPGDVQECAENPIPGFEGVDCNGSCQNIQYGGVESWQEILPFQTVCGRGFTYLTNFGANFRDLDTYRFWVSDPCSLALTINAEFASQLYVLGGSCGYSIIAGPYDWAYSCSTATFVTQCLQPGSYAMLVIPASQVGLNTPRDYRARVDLVPCNGCQVDSYLQAPGSAAWHTCGAGNNNNLRPSEDYTYAVNIPYASDWTFSTCNDDSIWDSYIYLTSSCNDGITAQDDDGCGGVGLSTINCVYLYPGIYYLTVEGWSNGSCGPFVLNVFECVGSCCYGNPEDPSCSELSRGICDSLSGVWNFMEPCSSGACYTRPQCSGGAQVSQPPYLPDESWDGWLSHLDWGASVGDNYTATEAVGSVRWWGFPVFCTGTPETFSISFLSGSNSCNYTVTTTGTQLSPLYGGAYNLTEYVAQISPPCGIPSGELHIAKVGDIDCRWYWSTALPIDGSPWGPDFAFCLGGACQKIDSVTIKWEGPSPDQFRMDWWVPQDGFVRVYSTLNPNDVFPAGYSVLASGFLPAGHFVWYPGLVDPVRIFVITVECDNGALQQPGENSPFRRIE